MAPSSQAAHFFNDFLLKYPQYTNKISVEFFGSYYAPALKKLDQALELIKNKKNFKYYGLKKKNSSILKKRAIIQYFYFRHLAKIFQFL